MKFNHATVADTVHVANVNCYIEQIYQERKKRIEISRVKILATRTINNPAWEIQNRDKKICYLV